MQDKLSTRAKFQINSKNNIHTSKLWHTDENFSITHATCYFGYFMQNDVLDEAHRDWWKKKRQFDPIVCQQLLNVHLRAVGIFSLQVERMLFLWSSPKYL